MTKGRLEYDKERQLLISRQAKLAYPIIDGVADMRIDNAYDLNEIDSTADERTSNESTS